MLPPFEPPVPNGWMAAQSMTRSGVGRRRHRGGPSRRSNVWKPTSTLKKLDARALELLALVGLESHAQTLAMDLPYGRKRALEIATTLAMDPELMLLDEPTAGMGIEDVARVTALIKRVSAGRTVLMVEHNMGVVSGICDRITVLQRGRVLAEGSYAEVSANPENAVSNFATPSIQKRKQPMMPVTP